MKCFWWSNSLFSLSRVTELGRVYTLQGETKLFVNVISYLTFHLHLTISALQVIGPLSLSFNLIEQARESSVQTVDIHQPTPYLGIKPFAMPLLILFLLSYSLALVTSLPSNSLSTIARLPFDSPSSFLPPSRDPWYTAPPGYKSAAPGDILRIRVAATNVTAAIGPDCHGGFQILYRTTDSQIQPSWAVTTILLPSSGLNSTGNGSSALLSYQFAYNSANIDTSPSYNLSSPGALDLINIQNALQMGWFVNIPDFEGPLASFTEGLQAGYATLDSMRSLTSLELEVLGLGPNIRCAIWGYSGGALASEWAVELQRQYAPKIRFVGAALGGLTPNVSRVLDAVSAGPFAGLAVSGILGMINQFPDVDQYILSELKTVGKYNSTTFLAARNETLSQTLAKFAGQNIYGYFVCGRTSISNSSIVQQLLDAQGVMGFHGFPKMPLFVYKAVKDEISPIADTDALVDRYCSKGVNIVYQRNSIGGHQAEATNGRPSALSYLGSLMAEQAPIKSCLTQDVSINISSSPL